MQDLIPKRGRGRPKKEKAEQHEMKVKQFIRLMMEFNQVVGFKMSVRGWCYLLENRRMIDKSDFDKAQLLINDQRRNGGLPNGFFAKDDARLFTEFEPYVDDSTPNEEAANIIQNIYNQHELYTPKSFWEDKPFYIQMLVEKVDLRELFKPLCFENCDALPVCFQP